jgi:hypothetical protein
MLAGKVLKKGESVTVPPKPTLELIFADLKPMCKDEVLDRLEELGVKSVSKSANVMSMKKTLLDKIKELNAGAGMGAGEVERRAEGSEEVEPKAKAKAAPVQAAVDLNKTKEWTECKEALKGLAAFGKDKVFEVLNIFGAENMSGLATVPNLIKAKDKAEEETKKYA